MSETPLHSAEPTLQGSILVLLQFDVCEAIRLDQLRTLIHARTVEPPGIKHPAQGNIRYQRPPVIESLDPLVLESGERLHGTIKYYDYGVLSVIFELAYTDGWEKLIGLASRWGLGDRLRRTSYRSSSAPVSPAQPRLSSHPTKNGSAKTTSSSTSARSPAHPLSPT